MYFVDVGKTVRMYSNKTKLKNFEKFRLKTAT